MGRGTAPTRDEVREFQIATKMRFPGQEAVAERVEHRRHQRGREPCRRGGGGCTHKAEGARTDAVRAVYSPFSFSAPPFSPSFFHRFSSPSLRPFIPRNVPIWILSVRSTCCSLRTAQMCVAPKVVSAQTRMPAAEMYSGKSKWPSPAARGMALCEIGVEQGEQRFAQVTEKWRVETAAP